MTTLELPAESQAIFDEQIRDLQRLLPTFTGFHLVQLGQHDFRSLVNINEIPRHTLLVTTTAGLTLETDRRKQVKRQVVIGHQHDMPLLHDSVDVIFMPYTLEGAESQEAILMEAWRVLAPNGRIIIVNCNPYSLHGLRNRRKQLTSAQNLQKKLHKTGFEITLHKKFSFRPLLKNTRLWQHLFFLERLGRYLWPFFGNFYVTVATKQVIGLTPIRPAWQFKKELVEHGAIEPTSRG